jgi:hypothetical protein
MTDDQNSDIKHNYSEKVQYVTNTKKYEVMQLQIWKHVIKKSKNLCQQKFGTEAAAILQRKSSTGQ